MLTYPAGDEFLTMKICAEDFPVQLEVSMSWDPLQVGIAKKTTISTAIINLSATTTTAITTTWIFVTSVIINTFIFFFLINF